MVCITVRQGQIPQHANRNDQICQKQNDIKVPGQDIFGEIPGYFGACRDSRKWLITSAKINSSNKASLDIVNDYGSEDLTAV